MHNMPRSFEYLNMWQAKRKTTPKNNNCLEIVEVKMHGLSM